MSTLASGTQWGQYHNTNNNRETSVAGNKDKRVTDYEHQDDKVQAIVNRGNRMQKIIKNLLTRNHHKKREILQGNVFLQKLVASRVSKAPVRLAFCSAQFML